MPDFISTDRMTLAKNRLELVSIITSLKPQFEGPQHMQTFENGWTHTWQFFDSLRIYLLLTCFDLLGQPESYKDFPSWLSAKSTFEERRAAISRLTNPKDPASSAAELYHAYNETYGTRKSFFRFVQVVLPESSRNELLFSIKLRRIDNVLNTEIEEIGEDREKLKYLYKLRNLFTHNALYPASGDAGLFPEVDQWWLIDGKLMKGYRAIYQDTRDTDRIEFSVRDWPDALIRAVNVGVARI